MKKKLDLNEIAKIEKAIKAKYGEEAIQTFKEDWDEEKEKDYLQQIKNFLKKEQDSKEQTEKIETNGFLISKKLLIKEDSRVCPLCKEYSFKSEDSLYMTKFGYCRKCHIKQTECRWRSNKNEDQKKRD